MTPGIKKLREILQRHRQNVKRKSEESQESKSQRKQSESEFFGKDWHDAT